VNPNGNTDYLVGFLILGAGTWDITVHVMPFNTASCGPNLVVAGSADVCAENLPAVYCSLIEPDGVTAYTEYASVPYRPFQGYQPGTTGGTQLVIQHQLSNANGVTYTIKCGVPPGASNNFSSVGFADISALAEQVSAV
jgi:hypothetical protein